MTAHALTQDALANNGQALFSPDTTALIPADCASFDLRQAMQAFERTLLDKALARNNGNQVETAKFLQVSRRTLINKINRYSLKTSS